MIEMNSLPLTLIYLIIVFQADVKMESYPQMSEQVRGVVLAATAVLEVTKLYLAIIALQA